MAARKKAPAKKASKKITKKDAKTRILQALQAKFGKDAAMTVTAQRKAAGQVTGWIPIGVDVIDNYLVPTGGALPEGRWSEWFGPEGCGKTALALSALAAVQRVGGIAVLIDAEHSFDEERATTMGVNLDDLIIIEPEYLDTCCDEIMATLVAHDASVPLLIVWDSIASLGTEKGFKLSAKKRMVGDVPAMLSAEFKKINVLLPRKRAHIMLINQVRANIGVMFGPNVTTPGGHAPKFYASVRGQFFGGKGVKNKAGEHIAKVVTLLIIKTRFSAPFRKARIRFDYADGYNNIWSTIEHAKTHDVIDPREDGYKGKGKEGIDTYIDVLSELGWDPSSPIIRPKEGDTGEGEVEDGDDDEDE